MARKILRVFGTLLGIVLGIYMFVVLLPVISFFIDIPAGLHFSPVSIGYYAIGGILLGLIFYILTPVFINIFNRLVSWADGKLKAVPTQDIALVALSLIITLLIGLLLSYPIYRIPVVGLFISPVVTLLLVFIGVRFVLNRKEEFTFLSSLFNRNIRSGGRENEVFKILDTSAIIDGRIVDICKTGFMEGVIVVASFVLEELRHIADSPDLLKRNRGRRGLDVLNKIQKEMDIPVQIYEGDFEEIAEVDSKLVKLAKTINGKIITNDFNLNKVCELQGISVLNINELANAVKPVVLPGEEMVAQIIKDGKEAGQGIAYLDDGTMIVVEGGRRYIGETIEVLVTSVLQTAAGRMIFAKPKLDAEKYSGVK
ncbi:MAG: PIN/TRAM domain-containing protein [Dethiobacteria bacterium]|nr:TRAM domain-containing protein [Bacillota bacterium]MDW7730400.1 TRAM domain-containing protein [Bacillota bacterium]